MTQPEMETHSPVISALGADDEEQAINALANFVLGSQSDPQVYKSAAERIITDAERQVSLIKETPQAKAARHVIEHLLDTTENGFFIDYDMDYGNRFVREILLGDPTYTRLKKNLSQYEKGQERQPHLRALAARGLWLFIEHS